MTVTFDDGTCASCGVEIHPESREARQSTLGPVCRYCIDAAVATDDRTLLDAIENYDPDAGDDADLSDYGEANGGGPT